jgi:hypothetical protein
LVLGLPKKASSHGLRHVPERRTAHQRVCSAEFQRTSRGWPLSRAASLLEVFSLPRVAETASGPGTSDRAP